MVSRLTRTEFTQALQDKKVDVAEAKADQKLAGLDVAKADLNHDGKIAGTDEAAALFREVDRYDNNGDASSVSLTRPVGLPRRPRRWRRRSRRARCSTWQSRSPSVTRR